MKELMILLCSIFRQKMSTMRRSRKEGPFGEEKGILNYALKKKVIPVSPNLFYAFLQVIVLGLKGLQVEKNAQKILALLASLKKDFGGFQEDLQ